MIQRFPFALSIESGAEDHIVDLRAGRDFHFDLDAVSRYFLFDQPSTLVDLLRIAVSVYVADRWVKRRRRSGAKESSRMISLKVEVFNQARWNRREIRDAIADVLYFLSGDFWDLEFLRDNACYERQSLPLLPIPHKEALSLICLYSGGLDSAAGLANRMDGDRRRSVIPVSVWHQRGQRAWLRKQYRLLQRRLGVQTDPLIMQVGIRWPSAQHKRLQERSQRCRSFLFASLGAVAAIAQGQESVEMFESGVGAMNLPLMAGMVGWKTTKGSHPEFLRLMSQLVKLVAERDIEFALPFAKQTKGEVAAKLRELELIDLANSTASCVGYPLRRSLEKQCGVCPACLFRRQAMQVAGISEKENSYKYDIFGTADNREPVSVKRLTALKAFLMQVDQLKGVELNDRLPRPFERHVVSTGIVPFGQSQKGVIDLLARYRDEWLKVAAMARRNGQEWAKWIATEDLSTRQDQGASYVTV